VSAYHAALERMQAEWAKRINNEAWAYLLAHTKASSPANSLPACKTCGNTGLVEDFGEGHGGLVFVTCPDCPAEPFPLP